MATSIRLRPWQRTALDSLATLDRRDFLAVATPGAGKTTFALTAAAQALAERSIRTVIVVAPTQHLKLQWSEAASRLGVHLDPSWSARDGGLPADMHGIVTTYQQVAGSSLALRPLASGAFVILDEVHHASDDRAWGEAILQAFDGAARRLSLSGTPFRSDTSAIPFVEYHVDEARPDFEYSYGEALADGGVVRPVFFPRTGGHMEWVAPDGAEVAASFADELTSQLANQRLRTALSLDGDWLTTVLADANAQLSTIRRTHPDAAGLVIAMDQEHANGIARLLRKRLGVTATVAVSDDPMASAKIARFARGTDQWIVAVRMVSEGVDIPRLRVGVFATNTTTELFFRQAVGRFVRWTRGVRSQKAFLYIPDDPRLRLWASGIAQQRRHSLAKRQRDDDGFFGERDPIDDTRVLGDDEGQLSLFSVISAVATDRPIGEASAFDDDLDGWDNLSEHEGFEISLAVPPPPGAATAPSGQHGEIGSTRRQLKTRLRDQNSSAVRELVRFTNLDHRGVNAELNRLSGITRVTEATIDELQRRLDAANRWLRPR